MSGDGPRRRRPSLLLLGAAAAVVVGIAGVVGVLLAGSGEHAVDMRGDRVTVEQGTLPSAQDVKAMKADPDTGERFIVPSVKLDVPLGALTETGDTITPPGFTSAYLVRNRGTSPATPAGGTVYVVTHSIRGGGVAPGNYLLDTKTGSSRLSPGDAIEVGPAHYRVTKSSTVKKDALPNAAGIWADTPNRLVVITCLQQASGAPSEDNLVIEATFG